MGYFPEIIKDGNLELRRLETNFDNARMVFDGIEKERIKLVSLWMFKNLDTIETTYEWMKPFNEDLGMDSPLRHGRLMGIFADGKYTGFIGIVSIDESVKKIGLIYYLSKKFEGRGYVSRAIKMIEQEFFGKLSWNKIEIGFMETNDKSQAIAERNGYVIEGMRREVNFIDGKFMGQVTAGKLKTEWEKENA